MKKPIYLIIFFFIFCCNTIDSGLEINDITLGSQDIVKDKVMRVNDKYYMFNTSQLNDGRNYQIFAESINKRNGSSRNVDWKEVEDLIIFFENKFNIVLDPYGGHYNQTQGGFELKKENYIPEGFKTIKDDIEYVLYGGSSFYIEKEGKLQFLYIKITDLKLKKIHEKE